MYHRQCHNFFLCNLVTEFSPLITPSLGSIPKRKGWTGILNDCWSPQSPCKGYTSSPKPSHVWEGLLLFVTPWCVISLMGTEKKMRHNCAPCAAGPIMKAEQWFSESREERLVGHWCSVYDTRQAGVRPAVLVEGAPTVGQVWCAVLSTLGR